MRKIRGSVVLPADAPRRTARRLVVEVRDVSQADAPSVVVAQHQMTDVPLEPNGRVSFQFDVPDVLPERALSLRSHLSLDGSERVKPGDLLTTASHPIRTSGPQEPLIVPVKLIKG
jgi:putative lipoprotein